MKTNPPHDRESRPRQNHALELVMRADDVALLQELFTQCRHLAREASTWRNLSVLRGPEFEKAEHAIDTRVRNIAKLVGMP